MVAEAAVAEAAQLLAATGRGVTTDAGLRSVSNRHVYAVGDIADPVEMEAVFAETKPDIVVHFAAETHVTRSIYDNYHFFETDVLGTQVIANAVLRCADRIERFVGSGKGGKR